MAVGCIILRFQVWNDSVQEDLRPAVFQFPPTLCRAMALPTVFQIENLCFRLIDNSYQNEVPLELAPIKSGDDMSVKNRYPKKSARPVRDVTAARDFSSTSLAAQPGRLRFVEMTHD